MISANIITRSDNWMGLELVNAVTGKTSPQVSIEVSDTIRKTMINLLDHSHSLGVRAFESLILADPKLKEIYTVVEKDFLN